MYAVCTWAANTAEVVLPDPPLPKKVTNLVDCWEELALILIPLPSSAKAATAKGLLRKWEIGFVRRRGEARQEEAIFGKNSYEWKSCVRLKRQDTEREREREREGLSNVLLKQKQHVNLLGLWTKNKGTVGRFFF